MSEPMRGIFPVLQTPLDADGELDIASLRREVCFCIEAGAHGLVFPALGSELQYLSDRPAAGRGGGVGTQRGDRGRTRSPRRAGQGAGGNGAAAVYHTGHAE